MVRPPCRLGLLNFPDNTGLYRPEERKTTSETGEELAAVNLGDLGGSCLA
ncbi:MAG: hypothetical protein AAB363_02215 [Planctomycetota bacterium]